MNEAQQIIRELLLDTPFIRAIVIAYGVEAAEAAIVFVTSSVIYALEQFRKVFKREAQPGEIQGIIDGVIKDETGRTNGRSAQLSSSRTFVKTPSL